MQVETSYMSPSLVEAFEKAQITSNVYYGRRGTTKGKRAEQRSLRAFLDILPECTWVYSARLSTNKEDSQGIDIVIDSVYGKLFVQIKSSHCGARHFRHKRPRCKAIVMIVPEQMSDRKLRQKARDVLGRLRAYYRKKRNRRL